MPPTYAVYAIRYATDQSRRRMQNLLGSVSDASMPMDYFVWALVNDDRTIVVDTGFGPEQAVKRSRTYLRTPAAGLSLIGVDAATVADVVITHMHYDHAGTLPDFPAARIHVQEAEVAYASGSAMATDALGLAFEVDDVCNVVRGVFERRVAFHDGDVEIAPGVSLHHLGGHTAGTQCVRVETARGPLVLASDASHYYENVGRGAPFPIALNVGDMLKGYDRMRALAASTEHIIPGHDPLVLERYPAASEALAGAVARLDLEPRA